MSPSISTIPVSEQQVEWKGQRSKLHELPRAQAVAYVQEDARLALAIYEKQRELDGDADLIDWECRAIREYCRMAAQGIRLNLPYIEERRSQLEYPQEGSSGSPGCRWVDRTRQPQGPGALPVPDQGHPHPGVGSGPAGILHLERV